MSENPEKTPKHPKEILIFAPFQPLLSRFAPVVRSSGSPAALIRSGPAEVLPIVQSLPGAPDAVSLSSRMQEGTEAHKARQQGDKRKRERETKERRRQAHKPSKERDTPPHRQGAGSLSPHHKFAPKNQQKVAWGRFEKIFGKIFRGNVSGERKTPCVISTEGGVV